MSIQELLDFAHTNRIRLRVEDDRLLYDAPQGVLTDECREWLRKAKEELLALLRIEQPNPENQFLSFSGSLENCETEKLEAALKAGSSYIVVRSSHLAEVVIFAPDYCDLPHDPDGKLNGHVVYRLQELVRLSQSKPSSDSLETIHAIKRELGGEYMGLT